MALLYIYPVQNKSGSRLPTSAYGRVFDLRSVPSATTFMEESFILVMTINVYT